MSANVLKLNKHVKAPFNTGFDKEIKSFSEEQATVSTGHLLAAHKLNNMNIDKKISFFCRST